MQTIAIYRGVDFTDCELVAEVECSMAPRVGETVSIPDPGGPTPQAVAEVNHLISDDGIRVRICVGPTYPNPSELKHGL